MSSPDRPTFQKQGPASNCQIGGKWLGWLSCTAYAMAMAIDRSTLGRRRPTGCAVRAATGDTVGGLTLNQVAYVARTRWDQPVEVRVGSLVCTPQYAARQCRKGRGFVLQGYTGVLVRTKFQSTGGGVNHAVFVNEVRGGTRDEPEEALVYDPAADGRYDYDKGPSWWPWSLVKRFAAALHPWGEHDARTLGPGKFYAGFMRDTEPHAHLKFGAAHTRPFPDRMRISVPAGRRANVRTRPDRIAASDVINRLGNGALFVAYQRVTDGAKPAGSNSRVWYGNHGGTRWIHESSLSGIGGTS